MAYNEQLAEKVRRVFAALDDVEEKRMFRGVTFMLKGKMCVSVGDNEIMCRIDPAMHEELVERNGCRGMIMKGKEYKGYVLVDEEALKTKKDLDYWIGLALAFNQKAKASVKKKK